MSEETVDQIINNAISTANKYTDKSEDAANKLLAANAGFYIDPPGSNTGFVVQAIEPGIPTAADSTLIYDAQLNKLVSLLSGQMADFFIKYYPLSSDAFDEATSWLVNTITNGGTGINPNIEDQIWQRDRDRRTAEGRSLKAGIVTGYAAKGYFLHSGSMLKKIERVDFTNSINNGIASTNIAAKQIEIEIETIKFAIGKAVDSRTMAMNAAADYIRAIAISPDSAAKVAALNTDVQAKMMSAAGDFYRVRLSRDELILKSKLAELDNSIDIYKHRRTNATDNDRVKVQALTAAADVLGGAAKAALSSLNSVASTAVNAFS